jgi:hypothetical protein
MKPQDSLKEPILATAPDNWHYHTFLRLSNIKVGTTRYIKASTESFRGMAPQPVVIIAPILIRNWPELKSMLESRNMRIISEEEFLDAYSKANRLAERERINW